MKALSRSAVLLLFLSALVSPAVPVVAAPATPSNTTPAKPSLSPAVRAPQTAAAEKPATKPAGKPGPARTPRASVATAHSSVSSSPSGQATPTHAAEASVPEPAAASGGSTVVLQDFAMMDSSIGGTWKDEKGSKIEYTFADAEKADYPDDKMLSGKYRQVPGGWCGIWYRAGDTWDGVDCSNPVALLVKLYTKKPMVIGFATEDENKNKLDIVTPKTEAKKWQTLVIPITNAPKGLKMIRVFNMYMVNGGSEGVFAIDWIKVVKK